MGIGFALASGLVQGFTQNIGREMERRAAEKEKLEGYRALLYQASTADPEKTNQAGVTMLQNMVNKAQGKLDEREGIDIFGRQGNTIFDKSDEDFSSVLSAISAAKGTDEDDIDYKSVIRGNDGKDYYSFYTDVRAPDNVTDIVGAMNALTFAIEADPDKWRNAPREVQDEIHSIMLGHGTALAVELQKTPVERPLPDLVGGNFYRTVDTFDKMYGMVTEGYDSTIFTDAYRNATKDNPNAGDIGTKLTDNGQQIVIELPKIDEDMQKQRISLINGFGATPENIATAWDAYTSGSVIGLSANERDDLWVDTIEFGYQFGITDQFRNNPNVIANLDKKTAGDMIAWLDDATGGDIVKMSLVIGAYQKPRDFGVKASTRPGALPGSVTGKAQAAMSARLFAAKVFLNANAEDKDFDKISKQHDALERVLDPTTGLNAMLAMTDEEFTTAPVLSRYAKTIEVARNIAGFIFDFEGDKVGSITGASLNTTSLMSSASAKDMYGGDFDTLNGIGVDSRGNEIKVVTQEYVSSLNQRITDARTRAERNYKNGDRLKNAGGEELTLSEMAEAYARFEALRISLAFQMARAADPSGRLSNQDIQQQFVRLAGDLDTPEMMRQKIGLAIEEFAAQKQRYDALMRYEESTDPVTIQARLQIQGMKSLDSVARKAGFRSIESSGMGVAATPEATFSAAENGTVTMQSPDGAKTDYYPTFGGNWIDSSGNPVRDPDILGKLNSTPGVPQEFLPPASITVDPNNDPTFVNEQAT